ncbi:hypothetical protein H5A34_14465 [Pectobacterium brasiliense]|uniref:hypothetical protein n=1 Tax=Pectobacterium brasiliense TaxID=180957 RepID=UPI00196917CE|nr:hypothetical protein [Pectobacterium brasiliense]MBN3247345.1 hypothetical protein [Pectobacterium brasiliense]
MSSSWISLIAITKLIRSGDTLAYLGTFFEITDSFAFPFVTLLFKGCRWIERRGGNIPAPWLPP